MKSTKASQFKGFLTSLAAASLLSLSTTTTAQVSQPELIDYTPASEIEQQAAKQSLSPESWFSLTWDNDIFVGSDGGYTNGLYGSWFNLYKNPQQQISLKDVPWYFKLQHKLVDTKRAQRYVQIHSFGQRMQTPADITDAEVDPRADLYAGVLFWQGGVEVETPDHSELVSIMVGIVGPSSGAEASQKTVHKLTGSDRPEGWDQQIEDEIVFNIKMARYWRVLHGQFNNHEVDLVTGADLGLGTYESHVDGSAYVRFGRGLGLSYPTLALARNREANPIALSRGYFLYAGFGAGYNFNNILVDGNTFKSGPSRPLRHGQNFASFGAAYSYQNWGVTVSLVTMDSLNRYISSQERFGSVSVALKI